MIICLLAYKLRTGNFADTYSIDYRSDGNLLAIGTYNTIYLVDPKILQIVSIIHHRDEIIPELWILCVKFSPDGKILASDSGDNVLSLWDMSNLTKITTLWHGGDVYFVGFSSDGKWAVFGGWNGIIRMYNILTKETFSCEGIFEIFSGMLSPDCKTLAPASSMGIVSFWKMPEFTTNINSQNKKPYMWGILKKK